MSEIVILFGLARRTARNSRKYHYFTIVGEGDADDVERLVVAALRGRPAEHADRSVQRLVLRCAPARVGARIGAQPPIFAAQPVVHLLPSNAFTWSEVT